MLSDLFLRLRALFRRDSVEGELDDELRFHFDQQVEKLLQSGVPLAEAQRQARLLIGGTEQIKEECRDARGVRLLETLAQDIRYSLRTLRKAPGFTLVAILTLALGIAVNTALFTIVNGVLLRPLPFPEPDRLVSLWERNVIGDSNDNVVSGGIFAEWQRQAKSFEQMALVGEDSANLSGDGGALPEAIGTRQCSFNLFSVLGVAPVSGRFFSEDDDRPGASATAVLTYGLWMRRYAADPAVIGKTVLLDAKPYVVIGVLPSWFDYPDTRVQLWLPVRHEISVQDMQNRANHRFFVTARLKPGVSVAQARGELDAIQQHLYQQSPGLFGKGASVVPLSETLVGNVKSSLYVLSGAVACVLLIACLNVASLFVARVTARGKELAVRSALGGSRWRIMQTQMVECFVLTCAAGALGAFLAWSSVRWLVSFRANLPHAGAIQLDHSAFLFTLGITAFCAVFAGLLPALAGTRAQLLAALKENSRGVSGSRGRAQLRKLLLTAEVALTVVLLVGGGLMLKSFAALRSANLGCATSNILTMSFTLPDVKYQTAAQKAQFFEELLARVRAVPGVSGAAAVTVVPGAGHFEDNTFKVDGAPPLLPGQFQDAVIRGADPNYFSTMNIRLLRGRPFVDEDRHESGNAMVISASMAKQFFPDSDPLGKHLTIDWEGNPRFEIVGIVSDVLSHLNRPAEPTMYLPLNSGRFDYGSLVVRSSLPVTTLALPIEKETARIDPQLAVSDVLTMEQRIGKSTSAALFDAFLVLLSAVLALILAAVGLYGLLSYLVTQRNNEIGVRMAFGAQRRQVMGILFLDGLRPTIFGLFLGLFAGGVCSELIRSLLFGVQPLDGMVFACVGLIVLLVAVTACTYPAWRAARIDPVTALRCE